MKNTANRLPIAITGGSALTAYLIALIAVTAVTKANGFWNELFATPRFRDGFVLYSMPFFIVGVVLIAAGCWTPNEESLVIVRRIVIGLCLLALALAGVFMVVFGQAFDGKISI